MRQPTKHTTKLPKQLLDELGVDTPHHAAKRSGLGLGRKERRKTEREQKKALQRQARPTTTRSNVAFDTRTKPMSNAENAAIHIPVNSRSKPQRTILKSTKPVTDPGIGGGGREATSSSGGGISRRAREEIAEHNAEIAALEKKLKIKGKKLPKAFAEDGLGDLLDGLTDDLGEPCGRESKRKRNDEEEWLQMKRRKARETHNILDVDDDGNGSLLSSEIGEGGDQGACSESEMDADLLSGDEGSARKDTDTDGMGKPTTESARPVRVRENPYAAPVTSTSLVARKYIPPLLRPPSIAEVETLAQLRRQIQGLLNRLSEANIIPILGEVESLYRNNPRQNVTSTLVELLFGIICDRTSLLDTFLILHAGFVAAIYKVIGTDFGAAILQRFVEEFDHYYREEDDATRDLGHSGTDKNTVNLLALLAELYNLQIIGSNLMFDYIRIFLSRLSETNTELLLKVIRLSGPQLRQDDPSALKDIVLMLQPAIASIGESNISVRTRFMIETINDLKNNRMKTGIAASTVASEHIVRMKKILGSLNTRTVRASEPLRLGLRDIRDADKKGKWWLVGASRRNEDEAVLELASPRSERSQGPHIPRRGDEIGADLTQLAKEQRMNTDIRRAIFITIMSASDYQDAHERLLKLRLKRAQELEVPRVLIHCAGAEQVYNPYYTLMAKRLCREHRLKMAFQFALWDLFKGMGEGGYDDGNGDVTSHEEDQDLGIRKTVNLAKLFGNLVVEGALDLGILKTLNLAYLQPKTRIFVELMLITVILGSQGNSDSKRDEKSVIDVFLKAREKPQVATGLLYFLRKVVRKTDVAGGKAEKETVRWGCRVAGEALSVMATAKAAEE